MIYENSKRLDREDVAILFAAMVMVNENHSETLDKTLTSIGYSEGLARCEEAARHIADLQGEDEPDRNWDGCIWYEMLERFDAGSLAYRLFSMDATEDEGLTEWRAAVLDVVQTWIVADPDDE